MNPTVRKIVLPIIFGLAAVTIAVIIILGPSQPPGARSPGSPAPSSSSPEGTTDANTGNADGQDVAPAEPEDGGQDEPAGPEVALTGLRASAPAGAPAQGAAPLGSLDWREADMLVEFAPHGAGIARITLADIWDTAEQKREAERIKARIERGEAALAEMPTGRYVVQRSRTLYDREGKAYDIPSFVMRQVAINGEGVNVFGEVWSQDPADPGTFVTEIRNDADEPVLRVTRRFSFTGASYGIAVSHRIDNLSGRALTIRLLQYGTSDLDPTFGDYTDLRRFRAGHLGSAERDPDRRFVLADTDFLWNRGDLPELAEAGAFLWPNEDSASRGYELSWLGSENRYFTVAIHPAPAADGTPIAYSIEPLVSEVQPFVDRSSGAVTVTMRSREHVIAPGGSLSLDAAIYAGPLDRHVLGGEQPYDGLRLHFLILYQMSDFCAFCTFQWLAHGLEYVMWGVHYLLGDWGVAIIVLVVVVRLLLHPITKRSQVNMQRFSRAMQKLKPELDKLQEKFGADQARLRQEQMRLWKEHNLSPLNALGCLPMFLQMPIWIALYAMLYFAFDLRHQPAFWGAFQWLWDWPFLGDLASSDHFFGTLDTPRQFLWITVTGFNLLPLLMGVIFYFQQKYMTPPASATMSPEQQQVQRMMKIMFPIMFPIMLYGAPSGLTLYIMTSSIWGIIESRIIRSHINQMDLDKSLEPKGEAAAAKKSKLPRDPQQRALAKMMERQRGKKKPPPRKFKDRE